jgi:predicted transcriptional regulator
MKREFHPHRLEAFAWIVPEEVKLNGHGRPVAYKVNPKVHVMFDEQAKKERERRAEQYEFMKGLKA